MTEARTFPNSARSVVQARRYVLDALTGMPVDFTDAVAVMASELATNSVRHAGSDFTVSIDRDARRVRVAVTDSGDELPSMRSPAPTELSGRGLKIVSVLADQWGVIQTADRPGKTVWFELAVPSLSRDAARGESAAQPAGARHSGARSRKPEAPRRGGSANPSNPGAQARRLHRLRCAANLRHTAAARRV